MLTLEPYYGRYCKVIIYYLLELINRVLFDIRLHTQQGDSAMAASMRRLIEINNQLSLFADLRVWNPIFRYKVWKAQT